MSGIEATFRRGSGDLSHLLQSPRNAKFTDEFLRAIPKTDLHLHLDGSLRIQTIIDLAKIDGSIILPSYSVDGLKEKVFKSHYENLPEYLECFKYMSAVMRTPEAIERIAYELACDNFDEGVRYFEARFAPQLLAIPGTLEIETILLAVHKGFSKAKEEYNGKNPVKDGLEPEYDCGIIVCGMRMFTAEMSPYYAAFLEVHKGESLEKIYGMASMSLVVQSVIVRDKYQIPIVGLDIAGAEDGFPAQNHREAYMYAHANFMRKTVHAGEAYGPESIFQAINDCFAERIGHGFHIFNTDNVHSVKRQAQKESFVKNICNYVADRDITLEVCITSNLQTMPALENNPRKHALGKMLEEHMSVSICTDNRTVSHTNTVKELRLAVDTFDVSPQQLKELVLNGFQRSFQYRSHKEKYEYVKRVTEYYEKMEKLHGIC